MVAQSSDSVLSTSHSADQRRPAIWPFIVMPLIVLVVFCILYNIRQSPDNATPGAASPASVSAETGTTGQ